MTRYILAACAAGWITAGLMCWYDRRYTRRQARALRKILIGDPT